MRKLSILLLSSLVILGHNCQAISLPRLTASSDKQVFIDGIKSFEDVLKLKDQNVSLITKDIKSDKTIWNNSLDAIKGFVELNAQQYLTQFNSLRNINDQLFNKLSINYASNISGKTSYDKTAINNIFQASPGVLELTNQANTLYSDLSKTVIAALPKTKAVRSVLAQLALTLKNIGNKIIQDINKLQTPSTKPLPTTQPAGKLQLTAGFASEQGKRRTMEDAHTIEQNQRFGFFAVYDGHGGEEVAQQAGKEFYPLVFKRLAQLQKFDKESINALLRQGFEYMEKKLRELIPNTKAGSTAVIALVDKDTRMLYIANLGDSRAVLGSVQNGKITATQLSTDHKASDRSEGQRILDAGGFVLQGRVSGNLAVSRALGDFKLKEYYDSKTEEMVTTPGNKMDIAMSEPEIKSRQLGPNDRFLILACDGVWDVMTNEEAATIVNNTLTRTKNQKQAAEALVQDALKKPKQQDNVTAVIIEFNY